jgi:hypothetical protein
VPRIRGPLKDFSHVVFCCSRYFSGIPELILHFTLLDKNNALHMASQVEVGRRGRAGYHGGHTTGPFHLIH